MQRKENFLPYFFLLVLISASLFLLSKTGTLNGPIGILQKLTIPFQRLGFGLGSVSLPENQKIKTLENQNLAMLQKLVDQRKLEAENSALRDQFQVGSPNPTSLTPVNIISVPKFIPAVTSPEVFIIDKGKEDGINLGDSLVFKDNLIGKVDKETPSLSQVLLITNSLSSFTAETQDGVLGVVRGAGGGEMILDNVLLSDTLHVSDLVLTKGSVDLGGGGFPPGLIVGKIVSLEKNPSSLFQKAKIKPIVDFSKLRVVFVEALSK